MSVQIGIPPGPLLLLTPEQFEPGSLAHAFQAEISSASVKVATNVHEPTGSELPKFLEALAAENSGWAGERTYRSYEGDFSLRASCDGSGHVSFRVILREGGHGEAWEVAISLAAELGQLEQLSRSTSAAWRGAV